MASSPTRKLLTRRLLIRRSAFSLPFSSRLLEAPTLPHPATSPSRFAQALDSPPVSRVFFSSSPSHSEETQGPVAIDYRTILPEEGFHKLADETLHNLQEKFEEYGDEVQVDGVDIDYGNHVLTLKLGNLGTYVINKQTPNRQIWLSSPVRRTVERPDDAQLRRTVVKPDDALLRRTVERPDDAQLRRTVERPDDAQIKKLRHIKLAANYGSLTR